MCTYIGIIHPIAHSPCVFTWKGWKKRNYIKCVISSSEEAIDAMKTESTKRDYNTTSSMPSAAELMSTEACLRAVNDDIEACLNPIISIFCL
jgi:hypothetical protein